MSEYKRIPNEDDDDECDCCGTPRCPVVVREMSYVQGGKRVEESKRLCEVCDTTYLTHLIQYPNQFDDAQRKIMITMAIIGNLILREIRGGKQND